MNSAQKELARVPTPDRDRIARALNAMAVDPFAGDVATLKHEETGWCRRVGNYRILYDLHVTPRLIIVAGIRRRTTTTYH